MKNPCHILITGASSGIGEALAEAYAGPGVVLMLGGRNVDRLAAVASRCENRGATVLSKAIDVGNMEAMRTWIDECDGQTPLDLIIANAGISAGTGGPGGESEDQVRRIFDINLTGVINTIHPAIDHMQGRRRGQVAIISSVAGFRGMPSAPAYCASKAAVKSYGEGLRGRLCHDGVEINVVCPGFVKSRMTDANTFPMPFLMDAERAAHIIKRGLAGNKGRIVFPWPMHLFVWLLSVMPSSWADILLGRLPEKT